MFFPPCLASPVNGLLPAFVLLLAVGCSGDRGAGQALEKSLTATGQKKTTVFPLAGKITVDGLPPELVEGRKIVVTLVDPANLDKANALAGPQTFLGKDGAFSFSTYHANDGVKPGDYIVTIAQLNIKRKHGLVGPDGFHNLYNDAERNQKEEPDFKINHQSPGKTNYVFDLKVAGRKELPAGSHALTQIVIRGQR